MDWKTYYQERHLTADEAVKHIKSGNRVLVGHACGEPSFLLDTMIGHKEDYENVEIVHMVAMGKCEYCQPGMEKHFHHNAYRFCPGRQIPVPIDIIKKTHPFTPPGPCYSRSGPCPDSRAE